MPAGDGQRELLGRLLAAQQQNIDLRARLDLEHQAGEGFLRFSERALPLEDLDEFWALATEETITTFDVEAALLLRCEEVSASLCAHCCGDGVTEDEVAALAALARELVRQRRVFVEGDTLPTVAGRATALAFVSGFRDPAVAPSRFVLVGIVSAAKRPFYPSMDAGLGPLFAAFANHTAALQQHIRARVAARQSAAQLARLAEVANRTSNAVVIADRDGRIEWVNQSFERMTGWSLPEVVGRAPGSFLHGPRTDPETRARMRAALARREPFDVEIANYTRAGRQYWVHIECRVIQDERGRPTGFVALESDVTERRIAALRDGLTQRVAQLLLASPSMPQAAQATVDAVVEVLGDLGVRAGHLWSVEPRRDALALQAAAVAADAPRVAEFMALTRELRFGRGDAPRPGIGIPGATWGTGRVLFESDLRSMGPQSRRLAAATAGGIDGLCAAPIRGAEGVIGVVELAVSVGAAGFDLLPTILERVAEQLAAFALHDQSRRAFRRVFEHSPDGMLLVDADGRVLARNARAAAMFGPVGDRRLDALLDDGQALVASVLGAAPTDGNPVALHHRDATGADGRRFSAEVSVAATPGAATHSAILAVRDLTERHRMEAAVARSLREKETLLKEIHHRVKNNLQIISSMLALQIDRMPASDARASLEESVQRVRSMAFIHQQIYGSESLELIDLGTYTAQLAASLHSALGPTVEITVDADPIEVHVETAVPLALILNELLTNAIKYGRPADPAEPPTVRVTIRCDGRELAVAVADRGPGIPPTFDLKTATSLGLQLVRSLTRQLRGQVRYANEGGAVARLTCPLPPGSRSPAIASAS